jgi:membrane protein
MKRLQWRTLLALAKDAFRGWKEDNCLSMGAALAFYSMLSLAPLLVLVVSIAGLVIGRDEARELLLTQMSGLVGETGGQGIQTLLDSASSRKEGLLQGALSFGMLLIGATTVLGELQDDLNRIWKSTAKKASGIWGQLRKRLLSFGLIVALGFLMLVSLVVSAAISYIGSQWLGGSEVAGQFLVLAASLLLMTAIFALTFKVLPNRKIPWSDVLLGAFATAVLFSIGKFLIGLYIGKSAVASDFGAAGTLVVVIVWVYYSSQIFFMGAQLTRAYSALHGSRRLEPANAEYGSDAAMVERAREIVKGRDPVLLQNRP